MGDEVHKNNKLMWILLAVGLGITLIISFLVWYFFIRFSINSLEQNTKDYLKQNYGNYYVSQSIEGKNQQILKIKFNNKFEKVDTGTQQVAMYYIQHYFENQWNKLGINGDTSDPNYSYNNEPKALIETIRYEFSYGDNSMVVDDKVQDKKDALQTSKDLSKSNNLNDSSSSVSSSTESVDTSTQDNTSTLTEDDKINAWTYAQSYMKNKLKSPSSAKFPFFDDSFVKMTGDTIIVSAYVDADNSFGANIRTNFTVKMDQNMKLQDISVSDN